MSHHKAKHENDGFSFLSEGMDFFSTILVVILIILAPIQIIYMISPIKVKTFIKYLEFNDTIE